MNPDLTPHLRPDDRIIWGQGAGEPLTVTEALVAQRAAFGRLAVFAGGTFSATLQPAHADHLTITSFGAVGTLRKLAKAGVLDIVPCHSGQVHRYISDGDIGCDVAFVQLSPPGPDGRFSLGVTNDYMPAALGQARFVVAEVNDRVPWTHGTRAFPTGRIDLLVETSRPLIQVAPALPGATDRAIAAHAGKFIEDGATLQPGIGAIPDAILRSLTDRRDLGLHAPMLGDAMVDLIEAGVITNARKSLHPGVTVTGLLVGTERLYRFADRNPALAVLPSDEVSDERVLAALAKFVTINSAIEIDLTGQVNAEVAGGAHIGAIGGQIDFVRAGHRSSGGRSILALPSTARGGAASRIVAVLSGPVTTSRSEIDVVVTEFGPAELRAQPLAERARRLIRIAHPDFQAGLDAQAFALLRRHAE